MPKFREIKQFTKAPDYNVDIFLPEVEHQINRYITNYKLDLSPDFQRKHVWTKEQQTKYIEFLLKGGTSSRIIYFNCPGFRQGHAKQPMVIVDGKQRIQAIIEFLNSRIKAFNHFYSDYEDNLSSIITVKFSINELEKRSEILQWYLDINTGGTIHSTEEIKYVQELLSLEK